MYLYLPAILFCLGISFQGMSGTTACPDSSWNSVTRIPDSVTRDPVTFARHLRAVYRDDESVVQALYTWLSVTLDYDPEMVEHPPVVMNRGELIRQTLLSRRGICINYAETFTAILAHLDIPAVTITGYTRHDNVTDTITGHAWNAVKPGATWRLYDPTWGGGYVRDGLFFKTFTPAWVDVSPDSMITSHMPFDPLWQLLDYPVTHAGFLNSETAGTTWFNIHDSISTWLVADTCARVSAARSRSERYQLSDPRLVTLKGRYLADLLHAQNTYSAGLYNRSLEQYTRLSDAYNTLANGCNSGKFTRNEQQTQAAALKKELMECRPLLDITGCPDSTLAVYQARLKKSFASLEKMIQRIVKHIGQATK